MDDQQDKTSEENETVDCRKCGICCIDHHGYEENCYIDLSSEDYDRIPESVRDKVTTPDVVVPGFLALYSTKLVRRKVRKGPIAGKSVRCCAAFRGNFLHPDSHCSIHEHKPDTCREFEAGSKQCLEWRQQFAEKYGCSF